MFGSTEGVGYMVITPFRLAETGEWILVNRGWVPKARKDPSSRREGQVSGTTEVVGMIRRSEKSDAFTGPNKFESDTWLSR